MATFREKEKALYIAIYLSIYWTDPRYLHRAVAPSKELCPQTGY